MGYTVKKEEVERRGEGGKKKEEQEGGGEGGERREESGRNKFSISCVVNCL